MIVLFPGMANDFLEKDFARAAAPMIRRDVNGMFDGVFITGEGAEGPITAKADEFAVVRHETDDGEIAARLVLEPGGHRSGCARFVFVERGRVQDGVVENIEDLAGIGLVASNEVHRLSGEYEEDRKRKRSNTRANH